MRRFWTESDTAFLRTYYPEKGAEYCSTKLDRTNRAVRDKARKLGLTSNKSRLAASSLLKAGEYVESLRSTDYEALEPYATSKTPILHMHKTCGYKWETTPDNIKVISGCPNCSSYANIQDKPTYLYLVYFESLDLYKIGVTLNWNKRKYEFGEKPTLLSLLEFSSGTLAYASEKVLKYKLQKHFVDFGILNSGNTETFIWPYK